MRFILYSFVFVFAAQLTAQTSAKIVFDSTTVNLGQVNQNETIRYVFNFKNAGSDSLIIEKVSSG